GAAAGDLIQLLTGEQHSEADGDQYRGIIRAGSTFVEHPGAGIYVLRHTKTIVADSIQAVLHLKTLDLVQQLYGPGGKVTGGVQRATRSVGAVDACHVGGAGCGPAVRATEVVDYQFVVGSPAMRVTVAAA